MKNKHWIMLFGAVFIFCLVLVLVPFNRDAADKAQVKSGDTVIVVVWGMTFTMNDISYWDLLPALTSDKKERDNLTTMVAVYTYMSMSRNEG